MGVDVDFDDNICDEVTDMMYCTLTADGARPSDKLLSVFSIDKDGKVDYYPSIVSGLQIVMQTLSQKDTLYKTCSASVRCSDCRFHF